MFEYTDGDGNVFVFRYIVTQGDEGSEKLEFFNLSTTTNPNDPTWIEWPDNCPIIREVADHFFGLTKETYRLVHPITKIEPRGSWYDDGDYISLFADEGSKNDPTIRKAQMKVVDIEIENLKMMLSGVDRTGQEYPSGPYLWTTTLFSAQEIDKTTADDESNDLVIAVSGGGDSFGFGYNWMFDGKTNEVYMGEDPNGSRVSINEA